MQAALSLIQKCLPLSQSPETIAKALTDLGLEVDAMDTRADGDVIFHISLTPDKGYCKSIFGIASDLAAYFSLPAPKLPLETPQTSGLFPWEITVESFDLCPLFSACYLEKVHNGPSPAWLIDALERSGLPSVNGVVDVLNYVMLLYGQPMHAYDATKIDPRGLSIQKLQKETLFYGLDAKEYLLAEDSLCVFSGNHPVALAGILGSDTSSIDLHSTKIILESAVFSASEVRKTAKNNSIRTESSHRFETGVSPEMSDSILAIAASMILSLFGGTCSIPKSIFKESFTPKQISLCPQRAAALLGLELSSGEICDLLSKSMLSVWEEKGMVIAKIPPFRLDLTTSIDLVEEIARMVGYTHFTIKEHLAPLTASTIHPLFILDRKTRTALISQGFNEWLTPSLLSHQEILCEKDAIFRSSRIEMVYAKSEDHSILRSSFLPGMLQSAKHNFNRKQYSLRAFEIGKLHFQEDGAFQETLSLGLLLSGEKAPYYHDPKPSPVDFFDIKGALESFLTLAKLDNALFAPSSYQTFHPTRQASITIDGHQVGVAGQIHPQILAEMDLEKPIYFAQINLEELAKIGGAPLKYSSIGKTPAVDRDWTVTLSLSEKIGNLLSLAKQLGPEELRSVELLDLYQDATLIAEQKQRATFRFFYQNKEQTLQSATVDTFQQTLQDKILAELKNSS